jgi:hypothetical protein
MAEVTENEKSRQELTNQDLTQHKTSIEAITGTLTTAAGLILMLTAFAVIQDPVMQLVVVSAAGLLIGGVR